MKSITVHYRFRKIKQELQDRSRSRRQHDKTRRKEPCTKETSINGKLKYVLIEERKDKRKLAGKGVHQSLRTHREIVTKKRFAKV